MARRTTYASLSARARALLRLEEGFDVEFKQSAAGIDAADLVAFANSESGGTILIGVAEGKDAAGRQVGTVVGCTVGDKAKLQILHKAMSCVPAVAVQVFVENVKAKAFIRVEVPSGAERPYSTSGGTYKIREDGRVRALVPSDLLQMFLKHEAAMFAQRFGQVTASVETQLSSLAASVASTTEAIESSVEGIASTLGWTDMKVDDTASDIAATRNAVGRLANTTREIEERLISLIAHSGANDPIKAAARKNLVTAFRARFKAEPELLTQMSEAKEGFKVSGERLGLFTSEEIAAIILEAAGEE